MQATGPAADAELRCRGRSRDDRANVAASWTCLLDCGEVFVGGSTDGALVCRRLDDGELIWPRSLDWGVVQLAACDAGSAWACGGGVVVAGDGGVLRAFRP